MVLTVNSRRGVGALGVGIVSAYGAVGDGVTDDTAAIQAAITAAGAHGTVYLPPATAHYKITAALDIRNLHGLRLLGAGAKASQVRQYTANTAVLKAGGNFQYVGDLGLYYNAAQAAGNTNANALELSRPFMSTYERLDIYGPARGLYLPQVDTGSDGLGNYVFASTFADINLNAFSLEGVNLANLTTNGTGCVFRNFYLVNSDGAGGRLTASKGFVLANFDDLSLQVVAVEWGKFTSQPLMLNGCGSAAVDGLHFEQVEPATWGEALLTSYGASRVTVRSMTARFNAFLTGNAARFALLKAGGGGSLNVIGLTADSNTLTSAEFYLVRSDDSTTGRVIIENAAYTQTTGDVDFPAAAVPVVRRINERVYRRETPAFAASFTPAPGSDDAIIAVTLTGNITVNAIAAPVAGQRVTFVFTQDGTGSRTGTWNAVYKRAGGALTLTTTIGKTDAITFVYDGANWVEVARSLNS